jgi:hypothetical protein
MAKPITSLLPALSGLLGTVLLGTYFGVGFKIGIAQLDASASTSQVMGMALSYHHLLLIGTWLQATGSALIIIFLVAMVYRARAQTAMAGQVSLIGMAVLLALVLLEGVCTIAMGQGATFGHPEVTLAAFNFMTDFSYAYAFGPAPLIFMALGLILRHDRQVPQFVSFSAVSLGVLFVLAGLLSLVFSPVFITVALALEAIWVVTAAIVWIIR